MSPISRHLIAKYPNEIKVYDPRIQIPDIKVIEDVLEDD
jgi:hypothetical protein